MGGVPFTASAQSQAISTGGVDEIDVIFLCAWLAAPVELRGSRTRVGRYRRRRRGTPNADDNLACVGMKIGFVAVSGFSERADSAYNGGGKSVTFRGPGDGCGEAGVSKGMEAFGRASDRLPAPRRRRPDPPKPEFGPPENPRLDTATSKGRIEEEVSIPHRPGLTGWQGRVRRSCAPQLGRGMTARRR